MSATIFAIFVFRYGLNPDAAVELFWLQGFFAVNAVVTLTLGASTSERHATVHALQEAHARLEKSASANAEALANTSEALENVGDALRTADTLLKATFESIPADIWLCDLNGRLKLQNDATRARWRTPTGEAPAALSKGGAWHEALQRAQRGERVNELEVSFVHNGEERVLLTTILPVDEGESLLGVSFDISDRVAAQRTRERLEIQLLSARRLEALGLLAGGVAHDLNNLLQPILGYAEIAHTQLEPDAPAVGELELVIDSAQRAAEIVQQLLTFGRRQPTAVEVLDLNIALRELERIVRHVVSDTITIAMEMSSEPLWVRFDPTLLGQIVLNLSVNAQDAMIRDNPSGRHRAPRRG